MKPEALALGAAACWALASLFSAPASSRMGAVAFSRWRMGVASVLLWAMVAWGGGLGSGWSWTVLAWLALSGLVGIVVGDTALFACMNRLGPRRSGLLFACHAMFSVWLAWWWLGESLWGQALIGSLLLMAGVMWAVARGRREDETHGWEQTRGPLAVGVGLGLLAALCQSVATLMLKPVMVTGLDPVAASATRMAVAWVAHVGLWATGWKPARLVSPPTWRDLGLTAASAAVAMALGMTLILKAMQSGQAGLVGVLSSMTPVLVLPLLWAVYRRRPAAGAWWGSLLAVAGVALVLG